ncbi:MAG: arginase [Rhodothermaceae bacterium]|nr:arginase [Rhodothermaceae bacterium]
MNKGIKLIKNRSDIGAGTRGSDIGVDAIEVAAINLNDDFFNRYPAADIETHNESIYNKVHTTFAKRIRHVHEQCIRVSNVVQFSLLDQFFPLVFSGDHSSALGTVSGIKSAFPNKTIGVVWIDAHADIHSPYTSPSGNVHGMPIAALLGEDNLENQRNTIPKSTLKHWSGMKDLRTDGPKMTADHLVYFGVRDIEPEESFQLDRLGIRNFTVEEIRFKGIEQCLEEATSRLRLCDLLYISFDVDSMDCHMVSNGTGTPVSKGFDQFEVIQILEGIINTNKVCCLEIAEVNPLLDMKGNKMAETAFDILRTVISKLEDSIKQQVEIASA